MANSSPYRNVILGLSACVAVGFVVLIGQGAKEQEQDALKGREVQRLQEENTELKQSEANKATENEQLQEANRKLKNRLEQSEEDVRKSSAPTPPIKDTQPSQAESEPVEASSRKEKKYGIVRREGETFTYNVEMNSSYKIPNGEPEKMRLEDGMTSLHVCTLTVAEVREASSRLLYTVRQHKPEQKETAIEVMVDNRNQASSVRLIQGFRHNFSLLPVLLLPRPATPLRKGFIWNLNCGETPVPVWSMKGVVQEIQGENATVRVTGSYRVTKPYTTSANREEYVSHGDWTVKLNTKNWVVESLKGSTKGKGRRGKYSLERSESISMTLIE